MTPQLSVWIGLAEAFVAFLLATAAAGGVMGLGWWWMGYTIDRAHGDGILKEPTRPIWGCLFIATVPLLSIAAILCVIAMLLAIGCIGIGISKL